MKRAIILIILAAAFYGCRDIPIGYLKTEDASYEPAELVIYTGDDSKINENQLANDAPWMTNRIQGVEGTQPINYYIAGVTASEGGNADAFRKELSIRGMGIMEVPLRTAAPKGKYVVSVKVTNEGYSHTLKDVFTFIIE